MLTVTILVLILVGLAVHRDLSAYWEKGLLPYPAGFVIFAQMFALLYLVNFAWMFGFLDFR